MSTPTIPPISTMGIPTPYLTVAELKASPIYNQLKKLVPGSSPAEHDAQLMQIILRVSASINGFANQNLAATVDNEFGRARINDDGDLEINTRNNPIIEVISLSVGHSPEHLVPVTNLSVLLLEPWQIVLPNRALSGLLWGRRGQRLWAQWTYINGFPTTTSTMAVSAGDTEITVADPTGVLPNSTLLNIEDGAWFETVAPTAVNGDVLTVAPLAYAHQAGVGVSALPNDIKSAAFILLSRLHDTWSLTTGAITHDGQGANKPKAGPARALCDPAVLIDPYRRRA